MPEEVRDIVTVMATGRSDYPNQINNVLGFPGFFRGLLDVRARAVNDEMKIAAAPGASPRSSRRPSWAREYIIPSVFDKRVRPRRWRAAWRARPCRRAWPGGKRLRGRSERQDPPGARRGVEPLEVFRDHPVGGEALDRHPDGGAHHPGPAWLVGEGRQHARPPSVS